MSQIFIFKDYIFCECGNETVTPCQCCDLYTPMCICIQCIGDEINKISALASLIRSLRRFYQFHNILPFQRS